MNRTQQKLNPLTRNSFYQTRYTNQLSSLNQNKRYNNTNNQNLLSNESSQNNMTPRSCNFNQANNINDIRKILYQNNLSENGNLQEEKEQIKQSLETKKLQRQSVATINKFYEQQYQEINNKENEREQKRLDQVRLDLKNKSKRGEQRKKDKKIEVDMPNRQLKKYTDAEEVKKRFNVEINQNTEEIDDIFNKIEGYADYKGVESAQEKISLCKNENNEYNDEFIKNIFGELEVYRSSLNYLKEKMEELIKEIKSFYDTIKTINSNIKNIFEEEVKNLNENKDILSNQIAHRAKRCNEIDEDKFGLPIKKNLVESKFQMKNQFEKLIENFNESQFECKQIIEKIFSNAKNFFTDLDSLSSMVNPINKELDTAFKTFNSIHDKYFKNTKNVEKLLNGLQELKSNLDNLVQKVNDDLKTISQKSQTIINKNVYSLDDQKELENYQNKINEKNEEINNAMNNQLGLINKLRASYNYEAEDKPDNKVIKKTNIIKGNENYSKIEQASKEIGSRVAQNLHLIKNEVERTRAKFRLDLLLIMDNTTSMMPYVNEVKNKILDIIDGIHYKYPVIDIKLGFIGYNDICDLEKDPDCYTIIKLTKDYKYVKDTIQNIKVRGEEILQKIYLEL